MRAVSVRMPETMRGQVLGVLGAAALEELGVGRHGGDRGAQLVRGVGHELAQVLLVLAQPRLRGDARREGRLNPLEHDVEGTGQAADLGGLVGAGHALVEVAGRDGVGGALHVLERAQAEPDQPPAAGQGEHECARGHRQLGQEEGVQGAVLVDERLRLHLHQVAGLSFSARTRKLGPPGATEPVVKYATCDPVGLGREPGDGYGQLRAVGMVVRRRQGTRAVDDGALALP